MDAKKVKPKTLSIPNMATKVGRALAYFFKRIDRVIKQAK